MSGRLIAEVSDGAPVEAGHARHGRGGLGGDALEGRQGVGRADLEGTWLRADEGEARQPLAALDAFEQEPGRAFGTEQGVRADRRQHVGENLPIHRDQGVAGGKRPGLLAVGCELSHLICPISSPPDFSPDSPSDRAGRDTLAEPRGRDGRLLICPDRLSGVSSTLTSPRTTARPVPTAVTPPQRVRVERLVAEALAVAAIPVIAYFVLRLRLMPFPDINDPAMHTTYIVDPRDFFERYTDLLTPTARMREGARVGLLVPGRISYLLFGPVGGFIAFRYVLALIAVAPAYLLMRRLSGMAAGMTAAAVVMTCPVILTAWGTDLPDSA